MGINYLDTLNSSALHLEELDKVRCIGLAQQETVALAGLLKSQTSVMVEPKAELAPKTVVSATKKPNPNANNNEKSQSLSSTLSSSTSTNSLNEEQENKGKRLAQNVPDNTSNARKDNLKVASSRSSRKRTNQNRVKNCFTILKLKIWS